MSKYGLQIRVKPSSDQQNRFRRRDRPPLPPPYAFLNEVERDISSQASKYKSNKHYEELQKKALEEDPSVFEYDGVFDTIQDKQQKREPKYISALMHKAKERKREHEIVYERKILKERSKDDHAHEGKAKFVTPAYKKKLAENSKLLEEERLREQNEDITKGDMSDFYFNLSNNIAFGAAGRKKRSSTKEESTTLVAELSSQDKVAAEPVTEQPKRDLHKTNEDDVAAAKERFLARKRAKVVDKPL